MGLLNTIKRALIHEIKTLRGSIHRRLSHSRATETDVVNRFHRLYFDGRAFHMTWRNTFWMGHPILKCPLDLWQYQEILHEIRPDLIIETGTAYGGSALHLAHLCDLVGNGRIITVDLEPKGDLPQHPRIQYIKGSSIDPAVIAHLKEAADQASKVMVILDSDHSKDHVLAELMALSGFVTPGSYLIVEDTNLNGHPVDPDHGPGPMEAVEEFLATRPGFVSDARWEKFFLSFNPRGYLRRTAAWAVTVAHLAGSEWCVWFATAAELL